MLIKLHKKLTFICTLITASILFAMAITVFIICKNQLNTRSILMLESHLHNISYRLQNDHIISQAWLSQMEISNNLVICIEDNGTPFLFPGALQTQSDRDKLIKTAKEIALTEHNFTWNIKPISKLQTPNVIFELRTSYNEHFLVGIAMTSSDYGAYNLILLKDMNYEDSQTMRLVFTFLMLIIIGVLLLYWFSYWFTARAIAPIKASNRKQTAFIAAASHELRSPLAVIQTSVDALTPNDPINYAHFLNIIHKECKRMGRLINDLLFLASTDAKTWSIHLAPVEIDTLLLNLYESLLPLSKKNKISFVLNLPDQYVPKRLIDYERFEQVLTILIDNAFTYTLENGHIIISLAIEYNIIIITIEDNGCGIPDEYKPHIFDRFYKIDTARHDKNHYGLGLSIAYEIIKLHSGSLTLEDTPGGGCTFVIKLPYDEK